MATPVTAKQHHRLSEAGFTLVEVVVVIAVIAIMAATMAPLLAQQIDQAREDATRASFERIGDALRDYHTDVNNFPAATGSAVADLGQLESDAAAASGWNGPYLTARHQAADYAIDPWGSSITYAHTSDTTTAVLTSPGIDHTFATGDDIAYTVLADMDAQRQRIEDTYELLKLIAGDVYGTSPTLAPSSYAIPSAWQTDPWGNAIIYVYNNDSSAVAYSYGPDGAGVSTGPTGDDIYYGMVWTPTGATTGGTAGTDDLVMVSGSEDTCSGGDKASFRFTNEGSNDLSITQISVSWTGGGNGLKRIQGQVGSASCGSGMDLWDKEDCGTPSGEQSSPAVITGLCQPTTIGNGAVFTIGELKFDDPISGETITVVMTTEPVGGGTSADSTIIFTAP
jgi:general secretion pathway protein G